ncbi:unnamed protein product [Mytilus edulis]|uniref:COR domain-containing protein n=1 Tax=Mytilus edulis TaxID=6550 RepID=A0A8S3S7X3_MYTED|nr:unnamed protein product [Mytilus edulis]
MEYRLSVKIHSTRSASSGEEKELPIISFHEMKHIADNTPHPLHDEELILFLKFHHELRTLVYFEDISDCIVLDTQWLSDAFKLIVTAEKFQLKIRSLRNKKKWDDLNIKGILHNEVLEDIFKKEHTILAKHKDHILKVMEKFDIIISPNKSGKITADEKPQYYVPCMIKEKPTFDIYKLMNAAEDTCKKSTWLCFKFKFLPPYLMNHLIASLCRQYDIAEVAYCTVHMHNRPIALFKGTVVFELTKTTKLQKLLITTYQNLILVQVLEFGTGVIFKRGCTITFQNM